MRHFLSILKTNCMIPAVYSEEFNLKNFENKPLVTVDNFRNIYKKFKTKISLLELAKNSDKDSYLIISMQDLKDAPDYSVFKNKYKPIGILNRTILYPEKFIIYHF